jgi:tetratricopeptide (TPR) repeat protein
MLSDKPSQSRKDQQPSGHKSEIITPIKVRSQSNKAEPSGPRQISIRSLSFLLVVLAALAAGGFIFIRHVYQHPADMTDGTVRTEQSEAEVIRNQLTATESKTTLLTDPARSQPESSSDRQQAIEPQQGTDPAKGTLERERAENLDTVNRLIESGKDHEKDSRFAFALTDYQQALKLDPHSSEAQESLKRVKEQIIDEQFQKLMSDGLTAYHKGKYQSARTMLLKAKSFRPDSREVQSALVQVNEAIRLDTIEKLRQKAIVDEQAEDWEQALKSYKDVLKIDPNISFAVQGKERSMDQIRIAGRITYFLQKPGVLESDEYLQNALLLIEETRDLQPRGPRLSEQINDFIALVDAARTPVQVRIESDNLTEVAVYRFGRLGRFVTRELSLRPGTYTVVGSRNGYRDIRQEIVVKPGQKELRVTVICRDKV